VGPFSDPIAIAVVVLGITYLTLILGELVPKRIGLTYPDKLSLIVALPMRWFASLMTPLITILSASTEFFLKIFMVKKSSEPEVTQDEIKILVEQATKAGVFEKVEQDIVERVLRLSDRTAEDIMTPRSEVVWLDVNDKPAALKTKILNGTRSRYPVGKGSLDKVIGIIHVKELLYESVAESTFDIRKHLHDPLFIPEHLSIFKLLEDFKESGSHMALTLDEYGVIQGIVTLNDVLEEIVGDIPTVEDVEEPLLVKRNDGSFLADGLLPIDKFKKTFAVVKLPNEENATYHTLGGYIMSHLGKVPSLGHTFEWNGFRFEIIDIDGKRIDKVLITLKKDHQE
jgi:putative hemolysin